MSISSLTIPNIRCFSCGLLVILLAGCTQDMADQPRYEPLEAGDRQPVPGTVARGELQIDAHF